MFFSLSRVAVWLTSPTAYLVILLTIGLTLKSRRKRKAVGVVGVLTAFLLSLPPIFKKAEAAWIPSETLTIDSTRHYTYAILPGGFSNYDTTLHRPEWAEAVDRLTSAVGLMKAGIVDTIIITGDGLSNYSKRASGGDEISQREIGKLFGIDGKRVVSEYQAKNTFENIKNTKTMLEGRLNDDRDVLIINSAMYMRRTMLCAEALGWGCEFYAVDYNQMVNYKAPSPYLYYDWIRYLHEIVGYASYWVHYK